MYKMDVVELLAIISRKKQAGETLEEIQEEMTKEGLHRDNTAELFGMLK